jgi:NADH pyrophosphatase NudC (nudix superfamily)
VRRDRLIEKFTVMQSDLGGLFYEMAIRDAVALDVLMGKAAELQRVEAELGQIERLIRMDESGAAGSCPSCGALFARGSAFCAQCGHTLMPVEAGA